MKLAIGCAALLALSLLSPCAAQNPRDLPMPCKEAVRLGLDRFVGRYTTTLHDESTAGNIAACEQYRACRRRVNEAQAGALPPARRRQVREIRQALDTLAETAYEDTYIEAGGGTMWGQFEADASAAREDALGVLIADLQRHTTRSPAARRASQARLRVARQSLSSLAHPTAPAGMGGDLGRGYGRSYAAARAAFARLRALVRVLPDRPARQVANMAAKLLASPAQNLREN